MPAKTTAKKAPAARKPTAKKPAARASSPSKDGAKNGATSKAQPPAAAPPASAPAASAPAASAPAASAQTAATQAAAAQAREAALLKEQSDRHQAAVLEKEEQLRSAQERIAALSKKMEEAPKPDPAQAQQLREVQARLTTRQAELEAARAESANLRDTVTKLRAPGEAGNLRCPRCAGHMTEYKHEDIVKADRCDACHAILLDNGELELIIKHHDEQRDAGKKTWLSSLFGGRK